MLRGGVRHGDQPGLCTWMLTCVFWVIFIRVAIEKKQQALVPTGHEAQMLAQSERTAETRRSLLDAFETRYGFGLIRPNGISVPHCCFGISVLERIG